MAHGIFGAVLRFVLHVPLAMWAFESLGYHYLVRDHPSELQNELYNPIIFVNLRLAGIGGVVLWVWNLLFWIPTACADGAALLLIGAVDAGFTVMLGFAVSQQTQYVPRSKVACGQVAPTFQVPAGNASFFQAVGALNGTGDAPVSSWETCNNFVDQWALGVAILVLMGLLTLVNLFCGVASLDEGPITVGSIWKSLCDLGKGAVAVPVCLPYSLFRAGIVRVYEKTVPRSMRHRLSLALRYACKYLQRLPLPTLRRPRRGALKPWKERPRMVPSPGPRLVLSLDEKTRIDPLAQNLLFDVLALVAQELHYIDLHNLGMTSRSVRNAVFPAHDTERRRLLRGFSCLMGRKARCWGCGLQVCNECAVGRPVDHRNTPTAQHLHTCRPSCGACVRDAIAARPRRRYDWRHSQGACACVVNPWPWPAGREPPRPVCRDCVALGLRAFYRAAEARAAAEASELLRRPPACHTCARPLPAHGVRWWTCLRCGQECRKRTHHGWAKPLETMEV